MQTRSTIHARLGFWPGFLRTACILGALGLASPVAGAPAPAPTSADATSLASSLDGVLDASKLKTDEVGVTVVDVASGKVLYAHNPDLGLNPASNAKLVTTATALAKLGPEYRYATRFYADANAWSGTELRGDLYIRGTGDPSLVTENLYKIARDLHARGLRRITGSVVVDASFFDADGLPPGFDQKNEFASYRAPGGATSVNFNTHVVFLRPGSAPGQPAVATVEPPVPCVVIDNQVTTAAGRKAPVQADSAVRDGKLHIQFSGSIGVDAGTASYRYPIHDPSQYAGEAMVVALRNAGIKVSGKSVKKGKTPAKHKLLATHRSPSLGTLIRGVNKHSNNFMAEQVMKSLAP
ncbi:MAG: D-alanyl-D-alanine carboxypeptidase/D-alanyl-D-alanine endopeptidase, partial [Nannocystaceae bacterium]